MQSKESTETRPGNPPWHRGLGRWVLRLIGVGLFIWVLSRVDLAATLESMSQAAPGWVAGAILLAIPTVTVRAWRLRLILRSLGLPLTLSQALLIRLVGTAGGDLLPGRAGEAITIAYLQRAGYGFRDPALALVLDRLFDLVILAVWAVGGLWLIGGAMLPQHGSLLLTGAIVAAGCGLAIAGLLAWRARLLRPGGLARRLIPARFRDGLDALLLEHADRPFTWNSRILTGMAAASLLAYAFLLLRGYLLVQALGLDLSLAFVAACMAITTLLQLVPINNVLGIGTREVSLVYLFGLVGVSPEAAVSFSLLIMLVLLSQDSVGLILWWRFPIGTPALGAPKRTIEDTQP